MRRVGVKKVSEFPVSHPLWETVLALVSESAAATRMVPLSPTGLG